RLAEPHPRAPEQPPVDVAVQDLDPDGRPRPEPLWAELDRPALDPLERAQDKPLGRASAEARRRGDLAQYLGHRTEPSPGMNGGLWKNGTRFTQSRAACRWMSE